MTPESISLIGIAGSIIVQVIGVLSLNKLLNYRVEMLEKELEKHAKVIDRVDAIETKVAYNEKEIDRLSRKIG